ncbi:unnamed protein product, partial [Mesorhabditis spiculigera]
MSKGSKKQSNNNDEKRPAGEKRSGGNVRKQEESPRRQGCLSWVIRKLFRTAFWIGLLVFGAATVTLLLNCNDGGKKIAGSKPFCADVTKLTKFTKPSDKFTDNAYNSYGTVIGGFKNNTIAAYRNFANSEWGSKVDKYLLIAHATITEYSLLAWRHIMNWTEGARAWYNKDGHKQISRFGEGVLIGMKMVLQMVYDFAVWAINGVVALATAVIHRGQDFVVNVQQKGFSKAFEKLIAH